VNVVFRKKSLESAIRENNRNLTSKTTKEFAVNYMKWRVQEFFKNANIT